MNFETNMSQICPLVYQPAREVVLATNHLREYISPRDLQVNTEFDEAPNHTDSYIVLGINRELPSAVHWDSSQSDNVSINPHQAFNYIALVASIVAFASLLIGLLRVFNENYYQSISVFFGAAMFALIAVVAKKIVGGNSTSGY